MSNQLDQQAAAAGPIRADETSPTSPPTPGTSPARFGPAQPPRSSRPGMVLDPLVPAPDTVGADLAEVAERVLEVELGS